MRPSTRIVRTNRRERGGRGLDLQTVLLHAAVALLTLLGVFRRHRPAPKVKASLSAREDERYREWARREAAGG